MNLGSPTMLSHVAYITHDTAATVRFYRELLGMELVNAVLDDSIPSTGDPVPYFHSFFRMADGSTVAFFEAPELPPQAPAPHPAYDVFQHLALQVDSKEAVDRLARLARRERCRGARPRRPQNHLQHLLPRSRTDFASRSRHRWIHTGMTWATLRLPHLRNGSGSRQRPVAAGATWSPC